MRVYINGKADEMPDNMAVSELIQRIGLEQKHIAVEINQEIISRSSYAAHIISEGDRVEIVKAIGGG